MSRLMNRTNRILAAGGALLVANSAYLAADGDPHPFYFANLFLHLGLGLVLAALFVPWWWRRRGERLVFASGLLLLASALAALVLLAFGNERPTYFLVWIHAGLAVAGLAGLVVHGLAKHGGTAWKLAAAGLALALALPAAALFYQRSHTGPKDRIVNPPAPVTMAEEAMGGAEGPYFPSSVSNAHGGLVPSSIYMDPQSCGRSGCHPDLLEQWQSSVHHRGSFNNQWYRKSIEYMQEVAGVEASKWCGGCHDPAILQSGMMDTPIKEIVHTPQAQAGITCTACHMITAVGSSMGQGDYEITVPPLHDLATSENRLFSGIHDFLVRMDPEPHRRTFIQPFFRGEDSAEYCSSCHKVHLDQPVNGYRWIRGFNEYDNWQASGVSGFGARSFYYPPKAQNCVDCHMPLVASNDAAAKDGMIRSHRFAAANTALPTAYQDEEQLRHVVDFLQARQVTVDIFAMTEGEERGDQGPGLATEGPALATTFAVGEESGMAVGAGGALQGPAEPVFAPLDRIPATVRRGESSRIDVVVRTRGVGHFFPGGTVDAYDCWVELQAVDSDGKVVYWSGMADEHAPVEEGAHFYQALLIDEHGNPIDKRNAWAARAVVYVRLIPPGAADTVRFRLDVPADAADEIELTARLNYRKFSWFNTHFAYAGEPATGQPEGLHTPDFDDREFTFTADMSQVSGPTKEVPILPIVVMSEDTQTLRVIDAGAELPDMSRPEGRPEVDRERWNDYGIGLFLQGDLRSARAAFTRVSELEPGYVDGWVNLARVAVAEGALEEAREVLDRALALDSELARAHFFLGLVEKESGDYEAALEHLGVATRQYPQDRVVRNQVGRVLFLQREYDAAVEELQAVLAIDPEDLMAHYTLMLAYRGRGDLERSRHHQALYERFKADEGSQELTREFREANPHDNNERQSIHEHGSPSREEIEAFLTRPERAERPAPDGGRPTATSGVAAGGG
ncbi:MAG TPA: tetratricopeptide repeat protein [Thermoanaerobaculia bacterium]|nr:tetratricopeptide repeat protein [Thermoanaerobaculia bacterium]